MWRMEQTGQSRRRSKIGQQLQLHIPVRRISATKDVPKPVMASQVPESRNQEHPKVGKLAYSDKLWRRQNVCRTNRLLTVAATCGGGHSTGQTTGVSASTTADDEEPLEWGMPTNGKVVAGFSENDNRKGVDIVGQRGQAVVASAAGKVVYSGSGLRGYGKLIIIKHNKTYLSAYAHNDQILVKEGQNVNKGQKIAEMGNTDADQVKLHFEIRKLGKPVDPAKYLPLVKS